MIDLCKIFGVEEGEVFKLKKRNITTMEDYVLPCKFKIINNRLMEYKGDRDYEVCNVSLNVIAKWDVVKLPKKKEFTDAELCILRNFNKEYKWIARDEDGDLTMFSTKPLREDDCWNSNAMCILDMHIDYPKLFRQITWEDEEPVFIDDYVERGAE